MLSSKDYYIDLINSSKADKIVSYYHYSGTGFKKSKINLGIYRKDTNLLVGALQWGCSAQEKIRLDRYVKNDIKKEEYLELNRFCMADSEGKNAESQAIGLGIKWIKKYKPEIKLLVSYAGRKEGNYGYIYQATNWEYLGYFISNGFWLVNGEERHSITLWNRCKKSELSGTMKDILCKIYQDVRQTWTKQFIYIYRIDKKLIPASPILPYPKPSNEFPICTQIKIYKENSIYNNLEHKTNKDLAPIYYYEKEDKLFSNQALRRQNKIKKQKFISYNKNGKLEHITNTISKMAELYNGKTASISNAIKNNKIYKDCWFKSCDFDIEPTKEIDIDFLCEIDGVKFIKQIDVAKYLNVSRQYISQACKKKTKIICGKRILWK